MKVHEGNQLLPILRKNLIYPMKRDLIILEKSNDECRQLVTSLMKENKILKIWLMTVSAICVFNFTYVMLSVLMR